MVDRRWEGEAGNGISPAPFLSKTYQLVDDSSTNHIVSWGDDRISTFVVWRPPEFARDLLPNYFKHNNFSSFVRQLNTYGFRKVVPERWEFANDFFRRGEKHLLCEIHRRKTSPAHPHFDGCDFPAVPCPAKRLLFLGAGPSVSAAALIDENDRLRRRNAALVSELAHMRRLYNDIIFFVQTHVRPVSALGPTRAAGIKSGGSASSSSSLTLADPDPQDDDDDDIDEITPNGKSTKIFGVHFCN